MTKLPTGKPDADDPLASLNEGIARLRSATGRPAKQDASIENRETRTLSFVCSAQMKPYIFVCERVDPKKRFKIAKAQKVVEGAAASNQSAATSSKTESFDVSEFDWNGADQSCAWCGNNNGWAFCRNCGNVYCGAKRNNKKKPNEFTCPTCKETFPLNGVMKQMGGSSTSSIGQIGQSAAALLDQAKRTLLPKWSK